MDKSKSHNKVINVLWLIIWTLLIVSFLVMGKQLGNWTCIETAPEVAEFYYGFLWPEVAGSLGVCMLVVLGALAGIWIFSLVNLSLENKERENILTKNLTYMVLAVALVAYMIFSLVGFRAYSLWFILYGVVVVMAVVCVILNNKAYKKLNKTMNEEMDDASWKAVGTKCNILLGVILVCVFSFSVDYKYGYTAADEYYTEVNAERIEFFYEHAIGIETNKPIVCVEFVNLFGQSGRQYTVEELDKEYLNYVTGEGNWSMLWQFCQDSMAIELSNQRAYDTYNPWCYGGSIGIGTESELLEYYFGEEPDDDDQDWPEYAAKADDKFRDFTYFATCVDDKLKQKGLTLSQKGDRWSMNRGDFHDEYGYLGVDIQSATAEEVYAVCKEVAAEINEEPIYVDSINIEMNVSLDQATRDVVVTELNGYEVIDVGWKMYEGTGYQGRQEWLYDSYGVIEAGKEYKAIICVKVPVWVYFKPDTVITVTGLNYDKLELSKDVSKDDNEWKIEVSFKLED